MTFEKHICYILYQSIIIYIVLLYAYYAYVCGFYLNMLSNNIVNFSGKSICFAGGPRVKKTRADAFDEEYTKMEAKFEEILASLRTSSPANAQSIRGLERTAGKKIEDCKKAGLFDQASNTEELCSKCGLLKEAIRVSGLYSAASGLPIKKHEDAFLNGLQKLPKVLRLRMSDSVQDHYLHLRHTKDRDCMAHDLYT